MSAVAHDRRFAASIGAAGAALGLLAGLVELTAGPSIRGWVGDKADTTRLGLATILLAAIAFACAVALVRRSNLSAPARLALAAGLLVPGLVCFTTVGRLWYVPGVLLVAAGVAVAASLRGERRALARAVDRSWPAVLTVLLATFYVFLGATALGVAGALGIAGGLLVLGLVAARGKVPAPVALALLLVAVIPFAALTWWSVATPLTGLLLLAIGIPALGGRRLRESGCESGCRPDDRRRALPHPPHMAFARTRGKEMAMSVQETKGEHMTPAANTLPIAIDPVQHARRWKTLAVLALSLVIIGLDNTILNVALPTLQAEFDTSSSKLQWMVDSYLLVFAGLLLVFGTLGDRFGRKLALQAGVSVFGLASLGALVAGSANEVIAVRAAMGVGAALIMPATLSIIANVFTGEERGKAIAVWAALAAVGIGLGPLAGGLLLEWFDWSSIFLVNVPFAVAALLLGFRYVPESRNPRPGRFDIPGAVLSTAGFSLLVYAIIEAPGQGWTSGVVVGSLAASVGLLGAFLWWERRVAEPMLDLGFFRSARFSVGTGAVSVAFFALLGGIFALTQYLQFAHGYSAIEAGAVMSPLALGLMIGAGSSSKAVKRLGTNRVVAAGLAGMAVLLASTTLFGTGTGAAVLAGWFFAIALAMGWIMAPATEAVVGAVPAAKSGVASATNTVARMVSGALGVAVIGSLVSSLYAGDLEGSLSGLPAQAQAGAGESVGAAGAVAAQLPPGAASRLLSAAGDAFTQAMGTGLLVAAALAAVTAVVVARCLPARDREAEPEPRSLAATGRGTPEAKAAS